MDVAQHVYTHAYAQVDAHVYASGRQGSNIGDVLARRDVQAPGLGVSVRQHVLQLRRLAHDAALHGGHISYNNMTIITDML